MSVICQLQKCATKYDKEINITLNYLYFYLYIYYNGLFHNLVSSPSAGG